VEAQVADSLGSISESARGRVQFGPLPPKAKAAIAVLDQRTRTLMDLVSNASDRCAEEAGRAGQEIAALGSRQDKAEARLDKQIGRVAVGGVRWEATGLFCVGLGVFIQWLAH
jgi:hypothetical protein